MNGQSKAGADQNVAIHVMRSLAIFLIVNSHLGSLYPDSRFAVGGHLGNSIFFFASGFGLTLSHAQRPLTNIQWYRKRFLKLFVPAIFFFFIVNINDLSGFYKDVYMNLVPHSLGQSMRFLPNLIVLYLLFPFVVARGQLKIGLLTMALSMPALMLVLSDEYTANANASKDLLYCFNAMGMFMLGMLTAEKPALANSRSRLWAWIAVILAFMAVHFAVAHFFTSVRFLNFYVNFAVMLALYFIFTRINYIDFFVRRAGLLAYIASLSLAVYILHFSLIRPAVDHLGNSYMAVVAFMVSALAVTVPATKISGMLLKVLRI